MSEQDSQLEGEFASGAPDALERAWEKYAPRIFKQLLRKSPTKAEDILHDTWLAIQASQSSYDPKRGSLSTWMYRIASNKRVDLLRTTRLEDSIQDRDFPDDSAQNILHELVDKAIQRNLYIFITEQTNDVEKHLLTLLRLKHSQEEAAEVMRMSRYQVRVLLSRMAQRYKRFCLRELNRVKR